GGVAVADGEGLAAGRLHDDAQAACAGVGILVALGARLRFWIAMSVSGRMGSTSALLCDSAEYQDQDGPDNERDKNLKNLPHAARKFLPMRLVFGDAVENYDGEHERG